MVGGMSLNWYILFRTHDASIHILTVSNHDRSRIVITFYSCIVIALYWHRSVVIDRIVIAIVRTRRGHATILTHFSFGLTAILMRHDVDKWKFNSNGVNIGAVAIPIYNVITLQVYVIQTFVFLFIYLYICISIYHIYIYIYITYRVISADLV